ncbi:hypothetical protein [Desulfosporosinus youngiae]|uniref:Uncharacterized protein n=1 Tax=Desulfosporosinus youngiae DSM 17734 TaxID=768710 RepID=H5XX57_9FIRM|nr:hypothetical protein [Desulfosporosinus youngiae]EHQ90997.1 hypothetical protein DesyoDRAFT_4027 [Desulfosporosinus youngiae DSM 17734]
MNTNYYKTWEEYLAEHPEIDEQEAQVMAPKMQSYEDMMFSFIMFLCA